MLPLAQTQMNPGFFTRGDDAPHPRIDRRWIAAVHLGLEVAFEWMRSDGVDLARAGEDAITLHLEDCFENRLMRGEAEDLDFSFLRSVTRESATANHDGSSIGRKPDLVFRLSRELRHSHNRLQDALFAECKPVDRAHPLARHYCAVGRATSGIERFVTGAYASAMEQGLMIGYVRDGFRIDPHLAAALASAEARSGLGEPTPLFCVVAAKDTAGHGLHLTTHQRNFPWSDGARATPIDLYHSWHDCQ